MNFKKYVVGTIVCALTSLVTYQFTSKHYQGEVRRIEGQRDKLDSENGELVLDYEVLSLQLELEEERADQRTRDFYEEKAKHEHTRKTLEQLVHDPALVMVSTRDADGSPFSLPIPAAHYLHFKQRKHWAHSVEEYVNFVTYSHKTVVEIAHFLTKDAVRLEEKAAILLNFVHEHQYDLRIEMESEYIRYPLETMVEKNGDCEDLSILGAALMKAVGIDVALIYFPLVLDGSTAHIGLGVAGEFEGAYFEQDHVNYFYAETTGESNGERGFGWSIGELPKQYHNETAYVYPVE